MYSDGFFQLIFDTINLVWFIVYIEGSQVIIVTGYNFQQKFHSFPDMKIVLVLENNVDPDEMLQYAAFHQSLHCQCTHLEVSSIEKINYMYSVCILNPLIKQ